MKLILLFGFAIWFRFAVRARPLHGPAHLARAREQMLTVYDAALAGTGVGVRRLCRRFGRGVYGLRQQSCRSHCRGMAAAFRAATDVAAVQSCALSASQSGGKAAALHLADLDSADSVYSHSFNQTEVAGGSSCAGKPF